MKYVKVQLIPRHEREKGHKWEQLSYDIESKLSLLPRPSD